MPSAMHAKSFLPLESDPAIFTSLTHALGAPGLQLTDVLSLDEPSLLPSGDIHALILAFPAQGPAYDARLAGDVTLTINATQAGEEGGAVDAGEESDDDEDVLWFKQTIGNACGFYALLHALANGKAKDFIEPDTILYSLLAIAAPLSTSTAALVFESSKELEEAYTKVARQGQTPVPASAEDEVAHHYVTFVKSPDTGHLFELDGDRAGPLDLGIPDREEESPILGTTSLKLVREAMGKMGEGIGFSMMALQETKAGT